MRDAVKVESFDHLDQDFSSNPLINTTLCLLYEPKF